MHFEILVEDQSGQKALNHLVPKIIDSEKHSFIVRPYKGIGRLSKGMKPHSHPNKRILLDQLPRLLRGYGNAFAAYPSDYPACVIVVCDLDDQCLRNFLDELRSILNACNPKPETRFCIAIEEGEAWFLGDIPAIMTAYPKAKEAILKEYVNDSVCGTWEILAEAVYPGGLKALSKKEWFEIGLEKSKWADSIAPRMEAENNASPSFRRFRDKLRELAGVLEP